MFIFIYMKLFDINGHERTTMLISNIQFNTYIGKQLDWPKLPRWQEAKFPT